MKLLFLALLLLVVETRTELLEKAKDRVETSYDEGIYDDKVEDERALAIEKLTECEKQLDQSVRTSIESDDASLNAFADLQVTKARTYWTKGKYSGSQFFGNQKRDIFIRLVYPDFVSDLQGSDFPVADGSNPDNTKAAARVLKKACDLYFGSCEAEEKIAEGISDSGKNWGSSDTNTLHNIFLKIIPTFYLDDQIGEIEFSNNNKYREYLSKSDDVTQLEKRWNKVSDALRESDFQYVCFDPNMPNNPKDRPTIGILAGMAKEIADTAAPNASGKISESGPPGANMAGDSSPDGAFPSK